MKAKYESELRESMKNEGCELISEYNGSNVPVYYLYNSLEYKVIPWKWKRGHRAHNVRCIRYTNNHIKKLFEDEGCELISEYKNQKSKLKYIFQGKEFEVVFNDWKFFGCRPHLGIIKTYQTEIFNKKKK